MKFILPPVFITFLMLTCGCCNFYQLQGNGPGTKAEWKSCLPDATTRQMDEIRVDASASDVTLLFDRGAYGGYTAKLHRKFSWKIPVGPYHERSFWFPDKKKGGRSLCMTLDCWGTTILPFIAGMFVTGDAAVYDYPSGACIAYERFMRAGVIPLVAYESSLAPVAKGAMIPGSPNMMSPGSLCRLTTSLNGVKQDEMGKCYSWPTTSLNRVQYNRLTSYYFLCGLLAFGQKNDRAYLQLAWIPIPLWSMDEESTFGDMIRH